MKKYNITKRWLSGGKPYMTFVGTSKGIALEEAVKRLRKIHRIESDSFFQDVEPMDEDLYSFSVIRNGIEFVYGVEEDVPFQELAEIVRPSNCCHFNTSLNQYTP